MRIIPRLNPPLRFYAASRLENAAEVSRLVHRLTGWGWDCTYDWTAHGNVRDGADAAERVREVCGLEIRGVVRADLVIFLLPGGRGMHTEIGLAIESRNQPRMILAAPADSGLLGFTEATSVFYHCRRAEHVAGGVDEVLAHLEGEGDE